MPRLTDISIRAFPIPERGQPTHWDDISPLGVRVSPGGTKSFVVLTGPGIRKTLGRYPDMKLSDAREIAKRIKAELTLGQYHKPEIGFGKLKELFFAVQCTPQRNKPRTIQDYRRLLMHFPFRRLDKITMDSIEVVIHKLAPSEGAHALVALKVILNFAVRRNLLQINPAANLPAPYKPKERTRVLTDEEIAAIYSAAQITPHPFGPIVLLLFHTAARRSEVANLKWENISEKSITFLDTKNNSDHTIPNTVPHIFDAIPAASTCLFPSQGKGDVFSGWGKAKARLDAQSHTARWTLHDIRRTVATRMAHHTPPHVIERLLNHAGSLSGVAGIYNRHKYFDEIRVALLRWNDNLATISLPRG